MKSKTWSRPIGKNNWDDRNICWWQFTETNLNKQDKKHLKTLKKVKCVFLIATDICSSHGIGISMNFFSLSIMNFPKCPGTYMFTELAEQEELEWKEKAVSFCDEDERSDLKNIQKLI